MRPFSLGTSSKLSAAITVLFCTQLTTLYFLALHRTCLSCLDGRLSSWSKERVKRRSEFQVGTDSELEMQSISREFRPARSG